LTRVWLAAPLTALLLACQTPSARVICKDKLRLFYRDVQGAVEIHAANDCYVPVGVEIGVPQLTNLRSDTALPVDTVLTPHSQVPIAKLHVIDPGASSRAVPSFSVRFWGTSAPAPDPRFLYPFPFGGSEPRVLVQGQDGALSHQGIDRYAFDFAMPGGTPIVAARDGLVLLVVDGFGEGKLEESYKDRANQVEILHADGTVAGYLHLLAGSIAVQPGDAVHAGQLLGESGNSGYSQGPHLHFEVYGQQPGAKLESIPIRFRGDVVPVERELYGPYPGPALASQP
jgi:murein DD-endopeptidase MepM/ murein hydrolase activator NlpD